MTPEQIDKLAEAIADDADARRIGRIGHGAADNGISWGMVYHSAVELLTAKLGEKAAPPSASQPLSLPSGASEDDVLAVFDDALTAAETHLARLMPLFGPEAITSKFNQHVNTHLWNELHNIRTHGHRNDDPNDPPEV